MTRPADWAKPVAIFRRPEESEREDGQNDDDDDDDDGSCVYINGKGKCVDLCLVGGNVWRKPLGKGAGVVFSFVFWGFVCFLACLFLAE